MAAPTALTARKESSRDFATRMKSRFVLKGPRPPHETTEGGITDTSTKQDSPNSTDNSIPTVAEGLLLNIASQSLQGLDLLAELRGKFAADPAFQPILERPNDFRNFEVKGQLVYLKVEDKTLLCIPKIMIQGRSAREIVISEAHSMLAHLGASKTIDYLRDHVWWKDMVSDIRAFCETCHTCKTSKPSNQKPYGLLNPLSIPSYPWESIGMDFVGPLPESGNRDGFFDSITVVICLLTSMVHLIPSRTNYNASQLAELMFEQIYKLHGLPKNIISDRDVLFTSTFWRQLHRLIGTKLKLSSAYHPQSDGSTERANRTITQMLRQCVSMNQKDWVTRLPAIEFAINSARSESTGFAPFFLNFGRMPRTMLWTHEPSTEFPAVRTFALQKKLAVMAAHDSVLSARIKQTRDANRKRREVPFKTGELVYLSSKNIAFAKGLARKLIPKFIGPYKILQDFGNSSFRLDLPPHLKRRGVHDVFHSSLLREHIPNDDHLFPGRMDTQIGNTPETEGEWAVEKILSHAGAGKDSVFEIEWKSGDVSWLPYYQVTHLQALNEYLDLFGAVKINKLPKGTGQPPQDNPQIFLGNISIELLSIPFWTAPPSDDLKARLEIPFQNTSTTFPTYCRSSNLSFITMGPTRRSLPCIKHPLFTRVSPTFYLIQDPDYPIPTTIHVGQITEYVEFDEELRASGEHATFRSVPIGYSEFSTTWNDNAFPNDLRRFSTILLGEDPKDNSVYPSLHPVQLHEFFITPEQTGLANNNPNQPPSSVQSDITQEYAALMAARQKKQRQQYEERQKKRMQAFSVPVKPRKHHRARQNSKKNERYYDAPNRTDTSSSPSFTLSEGNFPSTSDDSTPINEEHPIVESDSMDLQIHD